LLAIDETTEVRFLAIVALVVGASVESVFEFLTLIEIAWSINASILKDALSLSLLNSQPLDLGLDFHQWSESLSNRFAVEYVNWSLAGRAAHESEAHSQSWMSVLEQLDEAVDVECVATTKPSARSLAKLIRIANTTEFILF